MKKTIVKKHPRKTKRKVTIVRKHHRKIGSKWKGMKYLHGPRKISPEKISEFRLGKKTKEGKRLVFGKLKKTGKWAVQSKLTPSYSSYPWSTRISPTLDKMEEQLEERKKTANIREWADILEEEKRIQELRERLTQ